MLDITNFIKKGRLSKVRTGLSLEEYCKFFGQVEESKKHYYDNENPKYGFSYFVDALELVFVDNILETISINSRGKELTILSGFNVNSFTTLDKMLLYLEMLDLEWSFLPKYTFRHQVLIETKQGVQLSFIYEKGHGLVLSKIQKYLN